MFKQISISQTLIDSNSFCCIKGLFIERLINYKFTYVLWTQVWKTLHLPVSKVNSVPRIIFKISWGLVFSTMGTLIQFRKSEFIAYFSAAVSVTVLCVVAGRTQAGLSLEKSHKALEMKLPLQGQQIQLGTKPWTTVTFHWPVSLTLYSSWAEFNGKYP